MREPLPKQRRRRSVPAPTCWCGACWQEFGLIAERLNSDPLVQARGSMLRNEALFAEVFRIWISGGCGIGLDLYEAANEG